MTDAPLVLEVLPALGAELGDLLLKQGEDELAKQVPGLRILIRGRCGDSFCATIHTIGQGPPIASHRTIPLDPEEGMLIVDVVDEKIATVEVLYRDEVRSVLLRLFP